MNKISSIPLTGNKKLAQEAREVLAQGHEVRNQYANNQDMFSLLAKITIPLLDRKVKHGENLTFEESFCGMCYVLAATNSRFLEKFQPMFNGSFSKEKALPMAVAFMQLMATKESLSALTHEEIAGVVTASMMDIVVTFKMPRVVETCGMGGDKGFNVVHGEKLVTTINSSTLSALVLSALGLPAIKHGSYANTSAAGSTECIEQFGAQILMTSKSQVRKIWDKSGFCFFDAHWCKTIHDLSHLLEIETINHVIGPMTPPISPDTEVNRIMGVNEKIHPETVARAYTMLHQKGKQKVGGILVVSGLDERAGNISVHDHVSVKRHTIMDEISPFASVVAASVGDKYLGTCMLCSEDFGISINPAKIQIANKEVCIHQANVEALCGTNHELADYLAMNAALGLYAYEYLRKSDSFPDGRLNNAYLRDCFGRCRQAIASGKAKEVLVKYVEASGGNHALL